MHKLQFYVKILSVLIFSGIETVCLAVCDQTLSPGQNVAAIVASAPANSSICLSAGNYGEVQLNNLSRTAYVTIRSVSGRDAQMSPRLWNTDFVHFDNLTLTSMVINSGSTNIQITNSAFVPNNGGLAIVSSSNILIDNVDFSKVNQSTWSGRLTLNNATYSTIKNSKFIGVGVDSLEPRYGAADGIMVIGGAANNTIGPNNLFSDILQNLCDVANPGSHCDSIQLYGAGPGNVITGNHFRNNSVFIMAPDGSDKVTVSDNVFNGEGITYDWKIQFGSANGVLFEHNTLLNTGVAFDSKTGNPASTNILAKNNIIKSIGIKTSGGSGCSAPCTFESNMFGTSGIAVGSNNLIGIPIFADGTNPTSYAGFQLSSSSPGYKAASDGSDMGVRISSSPSNPPAVELRAPANLRIVN